MNQLDQLRTMTVVVADSGDIEAIRKHEPRDATTNPSLLFKAAQNPDYRELIDDALFQGRLCVEGLSGVGLAATLLL